MVDTKDLVAYLSKLPIHVWKREERYKYSADFDICFQAQIESDGLNPISEYKLTVRYYDSPKQNKRLIFEDKQEGHGDIQRLYSTVEKVILEEESKIVEKGKYKLSDLMEREK